MNAKFTVYHGEESYSRENIKGIMFVNGTLVINYIDNDGVLITMQYTRESLKDGNCITIY